jgi:hypothetical protein
MAPICDSEMIMMPMWFPRSGNQDTCVTFIFQDWIITDREKQALACLGIFLFAFLHEYLILVRRRVKKHFATENQREQPLLLNRRFAAF